MPAHKAARVDDHMSRFSSIAVCIFAAALLCAPAGAQAPDDWEAKVEALIAGLDAQDFEARERASQQLRLFLPQAAPTLKAELASSKLSYEQRSRIERILKDPAQGAHAGDTGLDARDRDMLAELRK